MALMFATCDLPYGCCFKHSKIIWYQWLANNESYPNSLTQSFHIDQLVMASPNWDLLSPNSLTYTFHFDQLLDEITLGRSVVYFL